MSKRKKNNPHKRYRSIATALLRQNHVAIVYVSGNGGYSNMVNRKTAQAIRVTPELSDAAIKLSYRWSIFIAALCRDEFGREYMRGEQISIDQPLLQAELADYLDEQHRSLASSCNQKHLVGVGWAADPFGGDWEESQASKLFDRFGGWSGDNAAFIENEMVA